MFYFDECERYNGRENEVSINMIEKDNAMANDSAGSGSFNHFKLCFIISRIGITYLNKTVTLRYVR